MRATMETYTFYYTCHKLSRWHDMEDTDNE